MRLICPSQSSVQEGSRPEYGLEPVIAVGSLPNSKSHEYGYSVSFVDPLDRAQIRPTAELDLRERRRHIRLAVMVTWQVPCVLTILLTGTLDALRQHRMFRPVSRGFIAGTLTQPDVIRHLVGDYGSEGWGFESLRARSVETDDPGP